ncbi:hypothetical protein RJ639_004613 [Escallonia herrerae]|uniref:Thaumatin-like protein n=1 Tax=Escallonia herrerae TaxID=1293975 RepID=A0AA88W408_9ASTE|nr:hypothetical protein RJ639_004613 [Escallonia herrerae]
MMSFKSLPMFSSIFLLISILFTSTNAAIFDIRNNCPFTVWAGAVPGGGRQLGRGQTWSLNVPASTKGGRIWPRTNCKFDGSGRGTCKQNKDFFDISLADGFNVAMEFIPTSKGCTRGPRCTVDIKGQCPNELKAPDGCNNPCTVFKTGQMWTDETPEVFQG